MEIACLDSCDGVLDNLLINGVGSVGAALFEVCRAEPVGDLSHPLVTNGLGTEQAGGAYHGYLYAIVELEVRNISQLLGVCASGIWLE